MGLFSSKKKVSNSDPTPVRREKVREALKRGMAWHSGDPDRDFVADRNRYYQALENCTKAEADFVEDALERHGYLP
jgi:hypothetical protein